MMSCFCDKDMLYLTPFLSPVVRSLWAHSQPRTIQLLRTTSGNPWKHFNCTFKIKLLDFDFWPILIWTTSKCQAKVLPSLRDYPKANVQQARVLTETLAVCPPGDSKVLRLGPSHGIREQNTILFLSCDLCPCHFIPFRKRARSVKCKFYVTQIFPWNSTSNKKHQPVYCMHDIVSSMLTVLACWSRFSNCMVCSLHGDQASQQVIRTERSPSAEQRQLACLYCLACLVRFSRVNFGDWLTHFGLDWSLVPDVSGNPVVFCEPVAVPGQHYCFCLVETFGCFTGARDMFCWR